MTWFGTDLVALGCIVGGAAVGGVATHAIMQGDGHAGVHAGAVCGVEAFGVSPSIAISPRGDGHAVVVRPDVRVRGVRTCARGVDGIVEIQLENHLEGLEAQLEHLDRVLEIELHQFEKQLQSGLSQEMEAGLQVEEARRQMEEALRQMKEAQVKVVVKRAEKGGM